MFDSFDFWADEATDSVTHFERRSRGHRKAETSLRMVEMGRNICFGGKGGGGSSPAPDPQIGAAAMKNAQVGEDWLNFAKEQFAVGNVRQDAMDELTNKVINQQLDTQDQQSKWALEDRTRYQEKFQPLQDEFIDTAKNYDSPERQAQMASEAKADVLKSADAQEQTNKRQMASMGLNPASGRYQGIERAQDLNTALSSAGAQNSARQAVRDKGLALKADAINMGNGLPSQSAAAASLGLNAGNSAVGNSNTANGNWRANVGIVGQGYQGAMQGYANQGNILNNLYGNQVNAWSAQQQANATSSAGLGSLLGTGLAAGVKTGWTFGLSDERLKERVLKVGQLENGIGVYSFEYKQPYKAQWGYGRKLGVMAQEVEKVIPEAVVVCDDGYKLVNYDTVLRKSGVIHGH